MKFNGNVEKRPYNKQIFHIKDTTHNNIDNIIEHLWNHENMFDICSSRRILIIAPGQEA